MIILKKILLFNFLFLICIVKSHSQLYNHEVIKKNDTLLDIKTSLKFEGILEDYYPGAKKSDGLYKNGLKEGLFNYYRNPKTYAQYAKFTSGLYLDSVINYKNGKRNGEAIHYFNNRVGNWAKKILNYKNEILNGTQFYYSLPAKVEKILEYKDGKLTNENAKVQYEFDFNEIEIKIYGIEEDTLFFTKSDSIFRANLKVVGKKYKNIDTDSFRYEIKEMKDFQIVSFTQIFSNPEPRFKQEHSNNFDIFLWQVYKNEHHEMNLINIKVKDRFGIIYDFNDIFFKVILKQ